MHTAGQHWGTTAIMAGCIGVAFCEGFDLQAAGVAAGGIVEELRPTPGQLGTFFSASTLGLFVGALGTLNAAGHGSAQLFSDILPLVVLASVAGLWFARRVSRMHTLGPDSRATLDET